MKNLVIVDVETTWVKAEESSIVSIGAVNAADHTQVFYGLCRIWAGAEVDQKALKVNGMSYDDITNPDRQTETELIREFIMWLPDNPIMIAHNASFDRDFVAAAAKRAGGVSPFGIRTIDIHSIVAVHLLQKGKELPKRLSLDMCLKEMGLPPEPKPHNALVGARCEAQLFDMIVKNKENDGLFVNA